MRRDKRRRPKPSCCGGDGGVCKGESECDDDERNHFEPLHLSTCTRPAVNNELSLELDDNRNEEEVLLSLFE